MRFKTFLALDRRPFLLLVLSSLAVGAVARAAYDWAAPLWLDETFTGAIAIQPKISDLLEVLLNDLSGPVYYSLIWIWEKLFGPSNIALRLPSFILAIAAPLLILVYGHPDRPTRRIWALMIALWVPSFYYATEARAYSLLLFLGCGQAITFCRLVDRPDLRKTTAWCAISALLVLTHYHTLVLTGFQGLCFLVIHRRLAFKTWPAALVFVPTVGWMSLHLPLVIRYSDPSIPWQDLLTLADLPGFPTALLGLGYGSFLLVGAFVSTSAYETCQRIVTGVRLPYSCGELATGLACFAGIMLIFTLGFVRPGFTTRYLIPFVPGLLLALSAWAREWSKKFPPLAWIMALLFLYASVGALLTKGRERDYRRDFSWQAASADFHSAGVRRIIFAWDNPSTVIVPESLLAKIGGFFLDRDGAPRPVKPVILAGRGIIDPNKALLAAADQPGDGIIWIFDMKIKRTRAIRYPPRIAEIDRRWACRSHSRPDSSSQVVTCLRAADQTAGVA